MPSRLELYAHVCVCVWVRTFSTAPTHTQLSSTGRASSDGADGTESEPRLMVHQSHTRAAAAAGAVYPEQV